MINEKSGKESDACPCLFYIGTRSHDAPEPCSKPLTSILHSIDSSLPLYSLAVDTSDDIVIDLMQFSS